MQRAVKWKKEFILDLIYRRLHNNHFLSSSGTQNTFKWQRKSKADCANRPLLCIIRVNILNCLVSPLICGQRCDSPFNYCCFKVEDLSGVARNIVNTVESLNSAERLCHSSNTWPRWVSKQRVLVHEMRERKEHPLNYVAGWYVSYLLGWDRFEREKACDFCQHDRYSELAFLFVLSSQCCNIL